MFNNTLSPAQDEELHDLHYLEVSVNGAPVAMWVEPGETLMGFLRDRLHLFGTKAGCERGECGACTVLLNGAPVYACLTLALQARGAEVITIEGLRGPDDGIHPIQRAIIEHNAVQCGFCTPGMIMSIAALLRDHPSPTQEEIKTALEGHLCRCGAYARILEALQAAQQESAEDGL